MTTAKIGALVNMDETQAKSAFGRIRTKNVFFPQLSNFLFAPSGKGTSNVSCQSMTQSH